MSAVATTSVSNPYHSPVAIDSVDKVITADYSHLKKAIDAVDQRINDFKENKTDKIKASAGLILTRQSEAGDIEILMGRLNKLNRPQPKDPAGVHGAFGLFSGGVELSDVGENVPTVCAAAAREVEEESLGALSSKKVLELLSLSTSTKLIENAGWKFFTAASFHVKISNEEGNEIVKSFNEKVKNKTQHEMTELAWISFKQLVIAQKAKDESYNAAKLDLEQKNGKAFTPDELRTNDELGVIYNQNVPISTEISVAHYVARTLCGDKDKLSS